MTGPRPDGRNPDEDRWIEALMGARLRFHEADRDQPTYKRWAQLYHRLYDPAYQGEAPYQPVRGIRWLRREE